MVKDYNLTRRTRILRMPLEYESYHKSPISQHNFNIKDGAVYVASTLAISVIGKYERFTPIPIEGSCFQDTVISMLQHFGSVYSGGIGPKDYKYVKKCSPYVVLCESNLPYILRSDHHFIFKVEADGYLFLPEDGAVLNPKACLGFAMQSPSDQGEIYLTEATNSDLFQFIADRGGPNLAELPISLASLDALPDALQMPVLQRAVVAQQKKALEAKLGKALPLDIVDYHCDQLIIDLGMSGLPLSEQLIKNLARYLAEIGYSKT